MNTTTIAPPAITPPAAVFAVTYRNLDGVDCTRYYQDHADAAKWFHYLRYHGADATLWSASGVRWESA